MSIDDEGEIYAFIFHLWAQEWSPREIADETGKSVDEIYRLLRKLEKDLVKEKGVENYGQKIRI
jgi:DNA-directed RNA polymerase specialized sigma24 family protein